MDHNSSSLRIMLVWAAVVLCAGQARAQLVRQLPPPYPVRPAAYTPEPTPADPLLRLEQRIAEMEAQHQQVVGSLQQRIDQLERQPHRARLPRTALAFADQQPAPAEEDLELEIERMLQQAEQGPKMGPLAPKELGEADELGIEALLERAEQRRAAPAPELGAGLGARLSAYNPNISVIGDFAGVLSSAREDWIGAGAPIRAEGFEEGNVDGFEIREMELLMTAAIDPYADGLLKLAFPEEGVEIEEAYALFHDVPFSDHLPQCLRDVHTKLGVFRMAFGPLNVVDCHDLPTVDRPLVIQQCLGCEGLIRAGVSMSKVIPVRDPWGSELTLEFVNGEPPGNVPGVPPVAGLDQPMGLVHYKLFRECEPVRGAEKCLDYGYRPRARWGYRSFELGSTLLATGSRAEDGREDLYSLMQGVDFLWQWMDPRVDSYLQYLLQGELFIGELDQPGNGVHGDVGGYLLGQARLTRRWFVGLRLDATEFPDEDGHQVAATPYVTYFFTEFNRARLQHQYLKQEIEGEGTEEAYTTWFQLVFAFGAHPPEPYYITQRF